MLLQAQEGQKVQKPPRHSKPQSKKLKPSAPVQAAPPRPRPRGQVPDDIVINDVSALSALARQGRTSFAPHLQLPVRGQKKLQPGQLAVPSLHLQIHQTSAKSAPHDTINRRFTALFRAKAKAALPTLLSMPEENICTGWDIRSPAVADQQLHHSASARFVHMQAGSHPHLQRWPPLSSSSARYW